MARKKRKQKNKTPTKAPDSPESRGIKLSLVAVAFIMLSLFVTSPSFNGPFVLDSTSKIEENPDLRHLGELPEKLIYPYSQFQVLNRNDPSRPVVFAVWGLIYNLVGPEPFAFRFLNALIHGLNALLLYLILLRLGSLSPMSPRSEEGAQWLALVPALFYLVVPIHVHMVSYAYSLSDVLSGLFLLSGVYYFIEWQRRVYNSLWPLLALYVLGLFSKQSFVIFPVLLFFVGVFCRRSKTNQKNSVKTSPVYFALGFLTALFLGWRWLYFGGVGDLESHGVTYERWVYFWRQFPIILKYVWLTVWPQNLAIDHYVLPQHFSPIEIVLSTVVLLAAGLLAFWGLFRGRTSASHWLGLAGLLFFLGLAPTSSLMPTVDLLVERRVYWSALGLCVALYYTLRVLFQKRVWSIKHLASVGGFCVLVYSPVSFYYSGLFADPAEVWNNALRVYPKSERALNNLANVHMERKEYTKAKELLDRLLSDQPADPFAYNSLGNVYNQEESPYFDRSKALKLFKKAISLRMEMTSAHYNIARIYQIQRDMKKAEQGYKNLLTIDPNHTQGHNNLGLLYMHQGQLKRARYHLERARQLDPTYEPAQVNLSLLNQRAQKGNQLGAKPSRIPAGQEQNIPPGAQPVPIDQVPADVIVDVYQKALAQDPDNKQLRDKFVAFCQSRGLECP